MTSPFFKNVGGKGQLLPELMKHGPTNFEAYHEPMVGGGALYWGLVRAGRMQGKLAYLSDSNRALIECYKAVRDEPERLVKSLELLDEVYQEGGEALYYRIRDAWNEGHTSASRFIFLKQTAFNGLWRNNRSGKLNMAWGKYAHPKILDAVNIRSCSQALAGSKLACGQFQETVSVIRKGDLVFYDPPYWGRFDLYSPEGFSPEQHVELVKTCADLCAKGVHVIYTNENSPAMREILEEHWPQSTVQLAGSRRFINCDGGGRQPVDDMIVSGSK